MSIREKIDRLVGAFGQANADDLCRDMAIVADNHGFAAYWRATGYSDARTGGFCREANLTGGLFAALNGFYAPRDRDEAIAFADRLIALNEKAKAELTRFRALINAPEEVEVAA